MLILNKRTFYDLAAQGLCGNTPRTWNSADEFMESCRCGVKYKEVGIRRTINASNVLTPGIPFTDVRKYLRENRIEEGTYVITLVPSTKLDHQMRLQGEFTWLNCAWYLFYTHKGGYMRRALEEDGHHAYGWRALALMQQYCSPSDYCDIMDLFDRYTEGSQYPVIEFSVTQDNCGWINGRNTIIWEIRHY